MEASCPHTSEDIKNCLQKDIQEKKFDNLKIICAVSNDDTNMKAAVREMSLNHVPCFSHRMQLVIKHAILNASALNAEDFQDNVFER